MDFIHQKEMVDTSYDSYLQLYVLNHYNFLSYAGSCLEKDLCYIHEFPF
jgi:hypothetical protein